MITKYSQEAFDYALYMMATSYFGKATCKSGLHEKKLCIAYRETKEKFQYLMEDLVIDFLEKEILPQLPKEIMEQPTTVYLFREKESPCTEIRLCIGDYILRLAAIYRGKKTEFKHQLWCRGFERTTKLW